MSDWSDAKSQVLSDSLEEFGEAISYHTVGGDTIPLPSGGIFSERFEELHPDTGAPVTSTQPNLVVRDDEWPGAWSTTVDHVLIGSKTYLVQDVQQFANQHALRLILHEKP